MRWAKQYIRKIMAFNFSFFGKQEHRVFNYKPIYFNQEKEERRQMFGQVDGTDDKKKENYTPGSLIAGSFRDGHYQRMRQVNKGQKIIGMLTMILLFIVIILIAKYYPMMWQ